jgi:hypothetical protein
MKPRDTLNQFRDHGCLESGFNYSPTRLFPSHFGQSGLYSHGRAAITLSDLQRPPGCLYDRFELTPEYPCHDHYKSEVFLSGYRNVKELLEKSPPPTAFMNTQAAGDLGLEDGDWIWIETPRGRIKHMLMTEPSLDPRVVNTEFGWGGTEEYKDCNINV